MAWNPRKDAGEMCYVWHCNEAGLLHGITRRCLNGHRRVLRYCDDHIEKMMALALHGPGPLEDGAFLGVPLCRECGEPEKAVLEGAAA